MKFVTRFAPSPTGYLHVGNLRTAIFNFVLAKKSGGKFILRLDDTDKVRSSEKFSDQIKRDLEWLGFEWDSCEKQSNRIPVYESITDRLRESGHLYECFETQEDLEFKRRKQLSLGRPPVYDRASLMLTSVQKERLREERKSYWRFKLDPVRVEWSDGVLGSVSIDAASVSDPVLIRADGQFLYTLASVVDDCEFDINYVIRGSDHLTNTATQVQLFRALASTTPFFAHHSLLVGPKSEPLSKRMNNLSIKDLRENGIESKALFNFMAGLGGQKSLESGTKFREILDTFNLNNFGSAPTKFDLNILSIFSQKCLMRLPLGQIESDLRLLKIPKNLQLDFWEMARENISVRADLANLWELCVNGAEPVIVPEDQDFISICKSLMPPVPRDKNSWLAWTNAIKKETSRSGKGLFLPLRKALTGKDKGPDMNKLFPLMQKVHF
ncbi:MAG: glutamate--tRNA ligase [Rhodobacteraceae bacterium]|nr:MAG: glutamate--tRNA ligase [Paracoccaceae bacterium]|tara:strand:- start:805 stop:2124 length:1320 start_codon:yes stop_codon:yes gene_type:complete